MTALPVQGPVITPTTSKVTPYEYTVSVPDAASQVVLNDVTTRITVSFGDLTVTSDAHGIIFTGGECVVIVTKYVGTSASFTSVSTKPFPAGTFGFNSIVQLPGSPYEGIAGNGYSVAIGGAGCSIVPIVYPVPKPPNNVTVIYPSVNVSLNGQLIYRQLYNPAPVITLNFP